MSQFLVIRCPKHGRAHLAALIAIVEAVNATEAIKVAKKTWPVSFGPNPDYVKARAFAALTGLKMMV